MFFEISREGFMICKVASLLKLQHVDIIVSTKKRLASPSFQFWFHTKSKILQDPMHGRLAYLNMSLWYPIPSHLYLRILNFLSHPCNHRNPTSTSIRNASKAFGSEDFAKMLLIFLWFCAEEYFSFNFFCTSIRWYHGKSTSGCRQIWQFRLTGTTLFLVNFS